MLIRQTDRLTPEQRTRGAQPHTRKTSPPQRSPLTHDHHCRHTQTQGPRWHNRRSAGETRTLSARDFVRVKVLLGYFVLTFPSPCAPALPGAKMSCRKRCKREIFKFAQYLFRLVTGTLNTGKAPGGLWVVGFSPPVAILLNLQRFWL